MPFRSTTVLSGPVGARQGAIAGFLAGEEIDPIVGPIRTHLFLVDELFRGTNAVERIAAGESVLRELISDGKDFKPHIAIAATHDGELVDLLNDRYSPYHFGDAIGQNGLVFDYHLVPGPTTSRNAITLLQRQP